jgi:hypothetical protein
MPKLRPRMPVICRSSWLAQGYVAERRTVIALAGYRAAATDSSGRHFRNGAVRDTWPIRPARTQASQTATPHGQKTQSRNRS